MTGSPAWVADYVGLPYRAEGRDRAGLDCWGLFRLVQSERFGLELPSYDVAWASDMTHREIAEMIARERQPDWVPIAHYDKDARRVVRQTPERAGDGVVLRMLGEDLHLGVVVAPNVALHVEDGTDSTLLRLDDARWEHRVTGIWRHRSRLP